MDENEIEFVSVFTGSQVIVVKKCNNQNDLAKELVNKLLENFDDTEGDFGMLVNGMGATPLMEQYIFANDVRKLLDEKGINVTFKKLGNLMTSIDMAGISLTLIKLEDDEWLNALEAPVNTIAW